jgi:hypothetical protein
MKYLGAEFYRNFIGIEKPLRVEYNGNSELIYDFLTINTRPNKNDITVDASCDDDYMEIYMPADEIKPRLKLPEDLTDEEWLWVLGLDPKFCKITRECYEIKGVKTLTSIYSEDKTCLVDSKMHKLDILKGELSCLDFEFQIDQEILNRMYSLHSHPKAKEYIDKNLAVRIE